MDYTQEMCCRHQHGYCDAYECYPDQCSEYTLDDDDDSAQEDVK